MQARTSIALAALLVLGGVVVARTAEPPDNVVAAVADAVQQCKDAEGTPNADAVLSVDDVNGDGGEDWIVDYAKLTCEGGINPMCGSGGCTLQVYLWDGATAWNLAFDDTVQGYKFAKNGGKRLLNVTYGGAMCGKTSAKSCLVTYRVEKDAIVQVK